MSIRNSLISTSEYDFSGVRLFSFFHASCGVGQLANILSWNSMRGLCQNSYMHLVDNYSLQAGGSAFYCHTVMKRLNKVKRAVDVSSWLSD